MQTFLPYADFRKSVKCLDNKRLGKQRVEALQILKAIYIDDYGWKNHPCVKMWEEYPHALQVYMNECIDEWIARGFKNTMAKSKPVRNILLLPLPHWLGNNKLHTSHQSNLLRKDYDYYSKYDWNIGNDMEYYWCGYSKKEREANG